MKTTEKKNVKKFVLKWGGHVINFFCILMVCVRFRYVLKYIF